MEKEKGLESKATTMKIKSATLDQVQGEDSGIQDLKRKLDDLTTVVKSVNYGGARPKQINNANSQGNDNCSSRKGPASSEGSQPSLDLTNHHSHLKERVQQQWPQDLSKMGVNHINATLVGVGS